jgi:hypothetical protein
MRGRSSGKTAPPVPGLTRVGGGAKKSRYVFTVEIVSLAQTCFTPNTVLTATSGPPVRCGAVRCGRRRSSDSDARRVGLSPGARNTTESASSRAHTVQ